MIKFGSIYSIENGFIVTYEKALAIPKHALEVMAERMIRGIGSAVSGESWKKPEPPEVPEEGYMSSTAHVYCADEAGVLEALKRAGAEHTRLLELQAKGLVHAVGVAHLVNPRQAGGNYMPPFGGLG